MKQIKTFIIWLLPYLLGFLYGYYGFKLFGSLGEYMFGEIGYYVAGIIWVLLIFIEDSLVLPVVVVAMAIEDLLDKS